MSVCFFAVSLGVFGCFFWNWILLVGFRTGLDWFGLELSGGYFTFC